MPMYSYTAVDQLGKRAKGLLDAANLIDLELHLKRLSLDLVKAKLEIRSTSGRSKIKRIDLITFFFNLDQLTGAGVPLLESLADLRDSMEEKLFREIIANLIEAIESGKTLSQAMALHANAFDKITVSLIHAGEASGKLPEVFKHLTASLKWQDELAAQTKNMLLYPVFVGGMVLAITFFLMIYLVPQLVGFIKSTGNEIPLQTRALLATSAIFVNYWYMLISLPFLLFAGFQSALRFNPAWQYHLDSFKLNIWPIGPVLRKIILARFANTFAMMYSSGISILDCIAHSRDLVNNQVISASLHQVMLEIESGKNLTQSFQLTGIFPPLVVRMLKVGEATGQLDQALLNVGYFYDRDVKDAIKKVQILIEPAMTIILGVLLGWVMLSVLSPIYDIISKVKM